MRNYFEAGRPMSEQIFFTLPRRGVRVIAPPASQRVIEDLRRNGKNGHSVWSAEEKARIKLLRDCKILARRYPTPNHGQEFMSSVCYERREILLKMAQNLTCHIVEKWKEVNPDKPIAVVLFGSVAKGLVKNANHPDPSNIDLVVVGKITDSERLELFDKIRPKRMDMRKEIRSACPNINPSDDSLGNAGVIIQDEKKLTSGGFDMSYIASGAFALYDPADIWGSLEREALSEYAIKSSRRLRSSRR